MTGTLTLPRSRRCSPLTVTAVGATNPVSLRPPPLSRRLLLLVVPLAVATYAPNALAAQATVSVSPKPDSTRLLASSVSSVELISDEDTAGGLDSLRVDPTHVVREQRRDRNSDVVGLTAAPERRHILFVGDGSFQVTAQELSTILRHDHKPVIFLINNGGYTIERGYLGKDETYNDVANWAYADLPKVFRRDTSARSFVVETVQDLRDVLAMPNETMIFVESIMEPYDALTPITTSSNNGAEFDYGPRGPQRRDNVQLRPAMV